MISHKHKCIFVHIPKVAGQSIEHVFLSIHGLSWANRGPLLLRPNSNPQAGPARLAHLTAHEYVKCSHLSEELFNSYFKFSFVRNPWDRLLSEFKWRKLNVKHWAAWVRRKCSTKAAADTADPERHVKPQYDFLFDEKGIGIPQQKLPHKNKSAHKHYTEYYDNETRQIVAKKYAKDIEYFGYEFG